MKDEGGCKLLFLGLPKLNNSLAAICKCLVYIPGHPTHFQHVSCRRESIKIKPSKVLYG
jgi:hypothetical protein